MERLWGNIRHGRFRRVSAIAVSLALMMAALFAVGLGAAGATSAAKPPPSGGGNPACPSSKATANLPTDPNVAAGFTTSGNVVTYTFTSLTNQNPIAGVPGLQKYCVFAGTAPSTITPLAHGANGAAWVASQPAADFSFSRPGGTATNIPLDGTGPTDMGSATWTTTPPTQQNIVLHVNDQSVCGAAITCFVKPSTGPRCDNGDTTVAYNAMPFDVVNCLNPGVAFEANGENEFGDAVTLQAGTGRTLNSLTVDFQSFACQTGAWNTGDCGSAPGATFNVPGGGITAKMYDYTGQTIGAELASSTINPAIPFRPSADTTGHCTGADAGKWFNSAAPNGGACQNSIAHLVVFNNFTLTQGITTLPEKVVWTVQFNTSHSGYNPTGTLTPPNPADSLNVGDKTYANAPYAGASFFDNGINAGKAVFSTGQTPPSALFFQVPDDQGRPLGKIITTP
jgi:hypothetical protein